MIASRIVRASKNSSLGLLVCAACLICGSTKAASAQTASPLFNPGSGSYTSAQSVTISAATSGSIIYFTLNGATPSTSSTRYTGPIPVSTSQTIRAIAKASGRAQSAVASASYTIQTPAATPTFNPGSGSYTSAQSVTISAATAGSIIYFTVNGATPSTSSTRYTGPIPVSTSQTIRGIATASGRAQSAVASASYTIQTPAATPTFSPGSGSYASAQSVTISAATSGSVIYFTVNGATPSTSSTRYTGPIPVSSSQTIRTIATASGRAQSAVASASYTIQTPAATPTFNPGSGSYTSAQSVTISAATAGSIIYFTLNGATPSTSSTRYTGPIPVSGSQTIKAVATASGSTQSAVASASYTVMFTPTLSLVSGTYIKEVLVTVTGPTGATLRCTTDKSDPTVSSSPCSQPVKITTSLTLKARAFQTGGPSSPVASADYKVRSKVVYLLIHGLNSDSGTWDEWVNSSDGKKLFPNGCRLLMRATPMPAEDNCYRVFFSGVSDAIDPTGPWVNGDGLTFAALGNDVKTAVTRIELAQEPAAIVLIGHSRGGLAARAFLQNESGMTPRFGLITVGTPNLGSPFGRAREYLTNNLKLKRTDAITKLQFMYAPSTGYLATSFDVTISAAGSPLPSMISRLNQREIAAAMKDLNSKAGNLQRMATAFVDVVSSKFALGVNLGGKSFPLWTGTANVWGAGTPTVRDGLGIKDDLLPPVVGVRWRTKEKKWDELSAFIKEQLPLDWLEDGDGVVPAASQRLSSLKDYGFNTALLYRTFQLTQISHVDEPGQSATLKAAADFLVSSTPLMTTGSCLSCPLISKLSLEPVRMAQSSQRSATEAITSWRRSRQDEDFKAMELASWDLRDLIVLGEPSAWNEVRDLLPSLQPAERERWVHVLGSTPAEGPLETLLQYAKDPVASEAERASAIAAIGRMGPAIVSEPEFAGSETAAIVESLMIDSLLTAWPSDPELSSALANSVAAVGSERGVGTLLALLDRESFARIDLRSKAAPITSALLLVRGSEGVPLLARRLLDDPFLSLARTSIVGDALSRMGNPEATEALLAWAKNTSGDPLRNQALSWLTLVRDTDSLVALERAVNDRELSDETLRLSLAAFVAERRRELEGVPPEQQ